MWYGMKIGMSYKLTYALPHGELMDLIAIEQIKHEGAKLRRSEEEEFFEILNRR